jgi:mannosyltransferase
LRSRSFWILAGLVALAAALRFATLGVQSYHHDEIVTAGRILRGGFWHAMDAVGFSESAPPLYYALAWLWTQLTGTGEVGLRSLSALAGVATVPVAYLIGRELSPPSFRCGLSPNNGDNPQRSDEAEAVCWAGVMAAALVAVNPMLLWYSQEARAYALFALLCAVSLLFFIRALRRRPQASAVGYPRITGITHSGAWLGLRKWGDLVWWGVFSALALATHYFAVFPIAAEALWLLLAARPSRFHCGLSRTIRDNPQRSGAGGWGATALAVGGVALAGLALAPLALHQMSIGHAEWIGNRALAHRIFETGLTFAVGETGDVIARPEHPLLAALPLALIAAALALILARGERGERRAAAIPLAIAAATVGVPVLLALASPSKDYVLARNLLPALLPLLVAVAIGATLRRARRAGIAVGGALAAYSLGFCVWASLSPALQRPDWRAVAVRLGEPTAPRAIVTWTLGEAPLRHYLSTGAFQAGAAEGYGWLVHEVDFVSDGPAPPPSARLLGPGFREAGYEEVGGRLYIRRYVLPGPGLAPLRLGRVRQAALGFRTNGVLLDGIGPS